MKEQLNIALIQVDLAWEQPDVNLQKLENSIHQLSTETDLIILPEMFSTGFSMNAEALAESPEGKTFKWMQKIAKTAHAAVTGSVIIKEDGNYYNRLFFVLPEGEFFTYDKKHTFTLAGEDKIYFSGKERLIVDFQGWKICPLICYDLRFPVWARNTEDYDVLIYVANWPKRRVAAWDALLKARAIENMSYCVGVNRTGEDGNEVEYPGHSMVFDGLGEELIDYPLETEQILTCGLHKSHIDKIRSSFRFLQDRDSFILK